MLLGSTVIQDRNVHYFRYLSLYSKACPSDHSRHCAGHWIVCAQMWNLLATARQKLKENEDKEI